MSDLATETPESDSVTEIPEPDSATENTQNTTAEVYPAHQDTEESSSFAALLLKLWNLVMVVSTAILSFYVFVLKDNSVVPFVMLGVIGLCIPPVVGMFRSMARNKRLRIEHAKRMEEARLERIREAQERERARIQRERMLAEIAENEEALQEALKNVDVEAIKINNSAQ